METYSETSVWGKHAIFYSTMRKRCKTCAHIGNRHMCGNRMYTAMRIRCWYLWTQQFETHKPSIETWNGVYCSYLLSIAHCTWQLFTVHRIDCSGIWHSMSVYLSKCAELDILLWDIHSFTIFDVLTGRLTECITICI